LEKILKYKKDTLKLVYGEEKGKKAWYIISIEKIKYPFFKKMMESGNYNLPSVGKVIMSGWGEKAPEKIINIFKK
jgi:hypothetical protein